MQFSFFFFQNKTTPDLIQWSVSKIRIWFYKWRSHYSFYVGEISSLVWAPNETTHRVLQKKKKNLIYILRLWSKAHINSSNLCCSVCDAFLYAYFPFKRVKHFKCEISIGTIQHQQNKANTFQSLTNFQP